MTVPLEVLAVARRLQSLRDEAVFVGGMIRDLLVTDPAATGSRPTKDVDLILDVRSWPAYLELGATLRSNGFRDRCSFVHTDVRSASQGTDHRVPRWPDGLIL